jgi:hypothetical protein
LLDWPVSYSIGWHHQTQKGINYCNGAITDGGAQMQRSGSLFFKKFFRKRMKEKKEGNAHYPT